MVKILDRLHKKLFDLSDLGLLLTLIERLKLLLQTEGERQQVAVVCLEFTHYMMAFQDASGLVGLNQAAQFPLGFGLWRSLWGLLHD